MLYHGLTLDPFQEEAINRINENASVLVAAPTGAGKTLIAEYAVEKCLEEGSRIIYTAPIKALSNQKYRDFTNLYGDRVGIKTGDVTINPDAQVILMTTEIFRNTVFESPHSFHDVAYAIFDEIHFLDDIERGTVWEESIIFAPEHIRFICLSATVPNLDQISRWIRHVRPGTPFHTIIETKRPIPLHHSIFIPGLGVKRLKDLQELENQRRGHRYFAKVKQAQESHQWRASLIDHLRHQDRLPAIYFAFNRRECEEFASQVGHSLLTREEQDDILGIFDGLCDRFGIEPDANSRHLRSRIGQGIAYHHAGLLPTLKEVIERIFTTGKLKLIFVTETFALGINMPARSVVFNSLHKFDGRRVAFLRTREHHQMSGRAGRRGLDKEGYIFSVGEWPHVRASIYRRILHGDIEPIRSQFNLSYSTLLTLWDHLGEKIYTAAEKSLSNFAGGRRKKKSPHGFAGKIALMKKKMTLLRGLDYISGGKLTRKGHFARNLQGYELQVSELLFSGVLDQVPKDNLVMVFNAVAYEAKRSTWHRILKMEPHRSIRKKTYRALNDIFVTERSLGIEDGTQEPDFKLASAIHAWSQGCAWADLEKHTSASDGDLVRYFRLTIQLLRNTMYALDRDHPLRPALRKSIERVNRDVVDAERQLRMGVEVPEGEDLPDLEQVPD